MSRADSRADSRVADWTADPEDASLIDVLSFEVIYPMLYIPTFWSFLEGVTVQRTDGISY